MKPLFFPSPSEWRAWLEQHHADTEEFWVGLYKRSRDDPASLGPSRSMARSALVGSMASAKALTL